MYSQKYEFNRSVNNYIEEEKNGYILRESTEDTAKQQQTAEQASKYMRIITSLNDPALLKLKRGKNTPAIHIFTLRTYMDKFQHYYIRRDKDGKEIANYYDDARKFLLNITDEEPKKTEQKKNVDPSKKVEERKPRRKNVNTQNLVQLFGGPIPDKNDEEAVKWFIIRRMNARVLELIYQRYMVQIMFGSSKMEDKLTNSLFIHEYRTRLPNPLLCGGLECIRPMEKQKKYPKKNKASLQKEKKENSRVKKTKPIEKKN